MSEQPNSPAQDWSAESYARNARFVADLGEPVVDWLDAKPGERVLDIGCGDGALTASIVARGADVVGIDSSHALIEAARARGIDARMMDVYALPFRDGVRRGVLECRAPLDARDRSRARQRFARAQARRTIRGRDGRARKRCGDHDRDPRRASRARNRRRSALAVVLPDAGRIRGATRDASFRRAPHGADSAPTPLPTGMRGWLDTFANPFLVGVS